MKKKGIVLKLFIITLLFFSFFLGIFMLGQTIFFKSFYLNTKISKLEQNIENFSVLYTKENWDSTNIAQNVNKFIDQNNAQIAILDKNGNIKYMPTFEIVLATSSNDRITISLANIAYLEGFQNLKLVAESEIEVEGYFSDDFSRTLSLLSIKKGSEKWENSNSKLMNAQGSTVQTIATADENEVVMQNNIEVLPGRTAIFANPSIALPTFKETEDIVHFGLKKISGKIVHLNIPSQIEQMSNYNSGLLWSSIDYWNLLLKSNKSEMPPDKINSFHYSGFSNGVDNIALVKSVIKENNNAEFIFVISSLQPVGEAIDTMKIYYLYAFLVALLLIVAMSLFFSNIISKPLITMNRVAGKMADLDFSEECGIKSKDELGSLAISLNRLSRNLGTSIRDLKVVNEQLQEDIEKERNLEKMRKEFISSVSHEFKTPLGIIKGFAEGFKDNIAEEKKDHYMDIILDEIEKMDELVVDLLDLAKLESRAYKLKLENFYIVDLLDEVQNRLLNQMKEKNIVLEFAYENKNLEVYGDRRRIEQVITNILSNAIRYTINDGYIKVCTVKEVNKIYVSVENSGNSILEEDLIRIWDRFYRTEKSRDKKTGGTGLGLPIVKNILELHESQFGVENTEGGVKFYFTLKEVKESNNLS